MNSKGLWWVVAAVLSGLFQVPALAAEGTGEGFSVTVGAKVWVNEWSSWGTPTTLDGQGVVVPIDSSTKVSLIPVVNLRFRDFYASFSTLLNTSYTLSGAPVCGQATGSCRQEDSIDASRKEFDANLGYYVLPGLGVSVGFKSLSQGFAGLQVAGVQVRRGESLRWTGPTIGATLTTPIQGGFAGYGAVGIGFFKVSLPADPNAPPLNGDLNANYAVGEIGLAYGAGGIPTIAVGSTAFTLGYRFQAVTTKDYKVSAGGSTNANGSTDLRDVTQGPALGFLLRF
jgi:hypothetical protein